MIRNLLSSLVSSICFAQDTPAAFWQNFTHRGYVETILFAYPRAVRGDSGKAVGEATLSFESAYKLTPWLRLNGAFEGHTDTHRQVQRTWDVSFQDRQSLRPAFVVPKWGVTIAKGRFTLDLGKQFIRWGKADILNPTDRFAPRDYVNVVQTKFLGVTGGRLTYGGQSDSIDLVFIPRFTPSRTPILGQRWVVLQGIPPTTRTRDGVPKFALGPQYGARWNHIAKLAEFSFSFYEGYNHLPLIDPVLRSPPLRIELTRFYPKMRMYGADTAVPLRYFTVKSEAAYFGSTNQKADEYVIYVVQAERQSGEWFFVGGYAGEKLVTRRSEFLFAPDRGLTRTVLGRAGYTIDANRSIALESAVRQDGNGSWTRLEYSQSFAGHWRATFGLSWIRGESPDFLGQYFRNSHASTAFRYSF
jgi:hypothetical protein